MISDKLVFDLGKPFQPSQMFVSKARGLPMSGALEKGVLWSYPQNFSLGWKGLPRTNTNLLRKSVIYGSNML